MTQPLLGQFDVCIVSWKTRDLLRACLRSVVGQPEVARVIVVDNASGDGTAEMAQTDFADVHLIANSKTSTTPPRITRRSAPAPHHSCCF